MCPHVGISNRIWPFTRRHEFQKRRLHVEDSRIRRKIFPVFYNTRIRVDGAWVQSIFHQEDRLEYLTCFSFFFEDCTQMPRGVFETYTRNTAQYPLQLWIHTILSVLTIWILMAMKLKVSVERLFWTESPNIPPVLVGRGSTLLSCLVRWLYLDFSGDSFAGRLGQGFGNAGSVITVVVYESTCLRVCAWYSKERWKGKKSAQSL